MAAHHTSLRDQIKPTPNAANEGLRQRIAIERNIAGVDRKDAALGHGSNAVRGNDAMLAFVYDREASSPFNDLRAGSWNSSLDLLISLAWLTGVGEVRWLHVGVAGRAQGRGSMCIKALPC